MSSPVVPPNTARTSRFEDAVLTTPSTSGRIYPGLEEMHPSKVQQSTTKQPDSGLRLGFVDIGAYTDVGRSKAGIGVAQGTPTKVRVVQPKPPTSPGFEFKFTRRGPELGPEAQKMMDDLREEAQRIKAQLAVEREEDNTMEEPKMVSGTGRKIAKAKGKAGRFSDVHMAEFKKMDSIAGHPSAFRLQPSIVAVPSATKTSLKRSKSQAKLDEPDTAAPSHHSVAKKPEGNGEEKQSPAKRMKQCTQDDTSTARPTSRDGLSGNNKPSVSGLTRSKSRLPAAVTTPTKASLARSASVKHARSMIPSLKRSSSTRNLGPKSEGSNKHQTSLANLSRMKSILRRPRLFSTTTRTTTDTSTTSHEPHQSKLDKELPSLPTEKEEDRHHTPSVKHVNFAPSTKEAESSPVVAVVASSPIRTLVQQSPSRSNLLSPAIQYPTLPGPDSDDNDDGSHMTVENIIVPSTGTGDSSPTRTIRHVRPSIVPPDTTTTTTKMLAIPHGVPNKKKRRHEEMDSDEENRVPGARRASPQQYKKQHVEFGSSGSHHTLKEEIEKTRIPSPMKKNNNNNNMIGRLTPRGGKRRILGVAAGRFGAFASGGGGNHRDRR